MWCPFVFLLLHNLEEDSCFYLLTYGQVYHPRPNPKKMLNFLKGPEGTQPPYFLAESGPLSDWTKNMTNQVYNPSVIKYETETIL